MRVRHYGDLKVWQKAMDLAVASYAVTRSFPAFETYGLANQIRRAASSIPANIAEGHGRRYLREYLQHLSIARGSLMELETHVILARRLTYLEEKEASLLLGRTAEVSRVLSGLNQALRRWTNDRAVRSPG
jgi:four helix bundle protein